MARHLKTSTILGLNKAIDHFVPSSEISAFHTRGVRYFEPTVGIEYFCGAMNDPKDGYKRRKHIIVRRYPRNNKVLQLYTYHFPKTWSAACVANRELIKEAQRQAHALEHDTSRTGLEWHLRFLNHYFKVFKGGEKPEPGMKPYSRFYQYAYVAIYRELQAAQKAADPAAKQATDATVNVDLSSFPALHDSAESRSIEPVSFKPIDFRLNPIQTRHQTPLRRIFDQKNVPKFAYMQFL